MSDSFYAMFIGLALTAMIWYAIQQDVENQERRETIVDDCEITNFITVNDGKIYRCPNGFEAP